MDMKGGGGGLQISCPLISCPLSLWGGDRGQWGRGGELLSFPLLVVKGWAFNGKCKCFAIVLFTFSPLTRL